jgi:hypothetical protein
MHTANGKLDANQKGCSETNQRMSTGAAPKLLKNLGDSVLEPLLLVF